MQPTGEGNYAAAFPAAQVPAQVPGQPQTFQVIQGYPAHLPVRYPIPGGATMQPMVPQMHAVQPLYTDVMDAYGDRSMLNAGLHRQGQPLVTPQGVSPTMGLHPGAQRTVLTQAVPSHVVLHQGADGMYYTVPQPGMVPAAMVPVMVNRTPPVQDHQLGAQNRRFMTGVAASPVGGPRPMQPQGPHVRSVMLQQPGMQQRPQQQQQQQQEPKRRTVQRGLEENVKRTVYVSYVDVSVTEEQLASFFSPCGPVMDCRICGDPNSAMRFAFLEFADMESAQNALAKTGSVLGGWPLRVQPSKTAIVPVSKDLMPRSEDEVIRCSRTVYVASIDKQVERADVRAFFEQLCGPVAKLRLLGDASHNTRIAFVEFVTAEGATAALNCSGALLGSLPVRVSPSKTPIRSDVRSSKGSRNRQAQQEGGSSGGGANLPPGPARSTGTASHASFDPATPNLTGDAAAPISGPLGDHAEHGVGGGPEQVIPTGEEDEGEMVANEQLQMLPPPPVVLELPVDDLLSHLQLAGSGGGDEVEAALVASPH